MARCQNCLKSEMLLSSSCGLKPQWLLVVAMAPLRGENGPEGPGTVVLYGGCSTELPGRF